MKYLIAIIVSLVLSSCSGTKQVVKNTPEIEIEVETTSEKVEIPIIKETEEEEEEEVIIEHDTTLEAFDHSIYNSLLRKHVTKTGNVNYKGFKKDAILLRKYINSLGDNIPFNGGNWSKEAILAYWINAYNAMTIDLIIRNYPLESIKDIDKPWDQRLWKLGSKWYNLNEIEHQILRKMNEPRIHFAIVCASFSCPKLQNEAFYASNFEEQLTDATRAFLADTNRNNISQNSLKLSKIFKWFANDFKQNGSLIDFINQYSQVQVSSKAKKSYKDYNWDLNN